MQPGNEPNADRQRPQDEGEGRLFPYNSVVGVVDEAEQVEKVLDALTESGFREEDVGVLCGEPGIRRIDAEGKRKGLLARVFRVVDRLGPEHAHTAMHVDALENGQFVVVVSALDEAMRDRARDALSAGDAHFVNYYSRWTVESLVR